MKLIGGLITLMALLALVLSIEAFNRQARADSRSGPWQLGTIGNSDEPNERTELWKVQDGWCSIYIVVGPYYNDHPATVAIATGQGCR